MKKFTSLAYTKLILAIVFLSRFKSFSLFTPLTAWFWSDKRLMAFYEDYRVLRTDFYRRYKEMLRFKCKVTEATKSLWETDEHGFDMAPFRHQAVHSTIQVLKQNLDALASILRECERCERILLQHHSRLAKLGIANITPILVKDPLDNMSTKIENLEDNYYNVKWEKGLIHGA